MHYSRLIVGIALLGITFSASPAYALERGTGSYLDYLIAKIEQEGLTITSQSQTTYTEVTASSTTSAEGSGSGLQPASPTHVSNWLRSIRSFSLTTITPSVTSAGSMTFGGTSWGNINMDVNTYHIIGDTGGDVQQTYDTIR